jgi:ADP-dependent NAD(P)H-hydrate dehydratase / NAD(P)H-hydrate epimerase
MLHPVALLTAEESRVADKSAMESGTSGETLMENAGKAIVDLITQEHKPCSLLVVCGTGNNGGDGFVAARMLKDKGWQVTLASVGDVEEIKGDAKIARNKWNMAGGATRTFSKDLLKESNLVVDALFGTGLTRDAEGAYKDAITAINESKLPVISIDMPSGIHADSGAIMGTAIRANHTVTFVRPKPGHVLLPGKAYTGELHVYDIGISGDKVKPNHFLNAPSLWRQVLPSPRPDSNKYSRGHSIVMGGGMTSTGAGRMAAMAALRAGSGLVSIVSEQQALPIYAMTMTAVMTKQVDTLPELDKLLEDKRITAVLIGPGGGVTEKTREQTLQILKSKKPTVIDADALTIFQFNTKPMFAAIGGPTVLTPHEGEFERLFSVKGSKTERAKEAAKQSGAVIVLKGNDTVIASPDGRLSINANAPVWLATAGSGDVLAGIITGLMAQGMPAFEAACAGTWIQGEVANRFGPGLIAEDLNATMPSTLKSLFHD